MIVVDWGARNYAESTTITSGRLSSMIWNGRDCRSSIAAGARQRSAAEGRTAPCGTCIPPPLLAVQRTPAMVGEDRG